MTAASDARSPVAAEGEVDFTITSLSTLESAIEGLKSDATAWRHRRRPMSELAGKALADYATYTETSPSGHQDDVIDAGAIPLLLDIIKTRTKYGEAEKHARVALGAVVALNAGGQDLGREAIMPLIDEIIALWKGSKTRWGRLSSALVALCLLLDSNGKNQSVAREYSRRAIVPTLEEIRDRHATDFEAFCRTKNKMYEGKVVNWGNYVKIKDGESDIRTQHQIDCSARMLLSLLGGADDHSTVGMLRIATSQNGQEIIECLRCAPELLEQLRKKQDQDAGRYNIRLGTIEQMHWLDDIGATVHSLVFEYPMERAQLLWAATTTNLGMMRFLVSKGANIKAIDESTSPVLCILSLKRVVAKYLLHHGADINAANSYEQTPLHVAVRNKGNVKLIRALIREGAKLDAKDKSGATPLQYLVTRKHHTKEDFVPVTQEWYTSARILCSAGASWDYDTYIESSARIRQKYLEDKSSKYPIVPWRLGLGVCVTHWLEQHKAGVPLTDVAQATIREGEEAVERYFQEAKDVPAHHKVCLVGSSGSGKTSLAASLKWGEEARTKLQDRTIGIDLLEFSFTKDEIVHEVTFWDFAGQDIYQGVHAPFFTRETLYLLCVDLDAIHNEWLRVEAFSNEEKDQAMRHFVQENVCAWARLVLLRQPEAEFQVVCTKFDMLTGSACKDAQRKLGIYVDDWCKTWLKNLQETTAHNVAALKISLPRFKSAASTPILTSSAKDKSVRAAQSSIQAVIANRQSALSLSSSALYSRVVKEIRRIRVERIATDDHCTHVRNVVVIPTKLQDHLMTEIKFAALDEYDNLMNDLHEHGDIILHDKYVVLDPMIVLDLTREIVSHQHEHTPGDDYGALRTTGKLTHKLLMELPMWSKMKKDDDKPMRHFFKNLLQESNLAYPTEGEMHADSDLMVPTYWSITPAVAPEDHALSGASVCRWQYQFSSTMADIVIKEFAVKSYHPHHVREVSPSFMLISDQDEFEASVDFTVCDGSRKTAVLIQVAADDDKTSWDTMSYLVMQMETVLDKYPSLDVTREIVDDKNSVNRPVQAAVDLLRKVKDPERLRVDYPWIPPDFDWFIEKAWQHPSKLKEIEARDVLHKIHRKQDVLTKLVVTEEKRHFPALFSVKYADDTKQKVLLQFYSDLTGRCHHRPIEIDLPAGFLDVHAKWLNVAIPIFSTAVSAVVSAGVVEVVAKQVGSAVKQVVKQVVGSTVDAAAKPLGQSMETRARRVQIADNLTRGFKLENDEFKSDSCLPSEAKKMVMSLLKFNDEEFEPADVTRISNLECVADEKRGSYLWVHPSEIKDLPDAIQITPVASWKKATPTSTTFTLEIQAAGGLSGKDLRDTSCEWRLVYQRQTKPKAKGKTKRTEDRDSQPQWNETCVLTNRIFSLEELRNCRLEVTIKRPSRWSAIVKDYELLQVATGEVGLADVASGVPIRVNLTPTKHAKSKKPTVSVVFTESPSNANTTP